MYPTASFQSYMSNLYAWLQKVMSTHKDSNPTIATKPKIEKKKLLCLTICGYRKPGMAQEAYQEYMTKNHADLVKNLMCKYGILKWTQTHNPPSTRALMSKLMDPQFANIVDYDCFSQVWFSDIEEYVKMKQDPFYLEKARGDHENFADTKRSRMTIGWVEEFIVDGKPL